MSRSCLQANMDDYEDHWRLTVGACLYRDGQHDSGVRVLTELAAKLDRGGDSTDRYELACAQYFLSLARFEIGHVFQVRRLLKEANRTADEYPQRASYSYWMRPVVLDALRQEAECRLND